MTIPLSLVQGSYIVAALMFILALAGLSKHETAKHGNTRHGRHDRRPSSRPSAWQSTATASR